MESLRPVDVLIIASAIGDVDPSKPEKWKLPVPPAFTNQEVAQVAEWVNDGGALLLIVDYMPVAGMSADLAAAFGVHVSNGYAFDSSGENKLEFSTSAGTLKVHPITEGAALNERVTSVRTFAGTAMLVPDGAHPLLLFPEGAYVVQPKDIPPPDTLPPDDAPRRSISGWSQAAALEIGRGRLVAVGEAAVFSAQRYPNGTVMGMNHPDAQQNKQFLLNVIHWLSGNL